VFTELSCVPGGLSVDSRPGKRAWAESLAIRYIRLLCDFGRHGRVAHKYGIFHEERGFSMRANVIIDQDMKVVFVKIYPVHSVPDFTRLSHSRGHCSDTTMVF